MRLCASDALRGPSFLSPRNRTRHLRNRSRAGMMHEGVYLVLLVVLVSSPAGLSAQDERPSDAHHRDQCRLAGQVLQTSYPRPKHEWALEAIRSCDPEVAVPALVQSWTKAPADTAHLMRLYRAGRRYRDGRLYTTVRTLASDPARPRPIRIAALAGLAAQVEPRIAMDLNLLRPISGLRGRWQSIWFWDNHGYSVVGAVPLPPDARAEVRRIADGIAKAHARDALADSAVRLVRFLDVEF
ncbi:MAG: hypothetical protein AVDCRST_MAG68-3895 [uncultured Gemmatimonadetes bacterium]|uniref:Uncharacterized protein n=1 Tax=uncultured Gemmatimonadota bacterium TaxID=203437 RepID=A0A6J4MBQ9_9BACT|nr:MAG: hypothetical protein AVDCRST_MAG68-3895 [uncultured Gemmatimonadota bacterium]